MKLTEIHIQERKTDRYWSVSIDPFFERDNKKRGHHGRVDAYSERGFGVDEWAPSHVNWFSIGAVSAEEADAFQKAVATAVEYAKRMNKEHGIS
jgi:hypothetical protein